MKCHSELWEKYKDGVISEHEQEQLEAHLEHCDECSDYLQQLLQEEEKPVLPAPPKLSLRRLKWKQRATNAFTTIVLVLALYFGLLFASGLYYGIDRASKITDIASLAVQTTMPNVNPSGSTTSYMPWFTFSSDIPLQKAIGKDNETIGSLHMSGIFAVPSKVDRNWNDGSYEMKLAFLYPGEKTEETSIAAWQALEKLPEGTVSELAISFDKTYTYAQIQELLYSVFEAQELPPTPVWYALATGLEAKENNLLSEDNIFGFPEMFQASLGDNGTEEENVLQMMKLLSQNEKMVSKVAIFREDDLQLQKRYQYVKKNGVGVYGIVITGPTKELLKLKQADFVTFASLGETALWNWFDRPIDGEMW